MCIARGRWRGEGRGAFGSVWIPECSKRPQKSVVFHLQTERVQGLNLNALNKCPLVVDLGL